MANKSSTHGGAFNEGTLICGTLRQQDLLRAFADEYVRLLPFNGARLAREARDMADIIEGNCTDYDVQAANDILADLFDSLDYLASAEGYTFGAHEGDGSDFGFWLVDND